MKIHTKYPLPGYIYNPRNENRKGSFQKPCIFLVHHVSFLLSEFTVSEFNLESIIENIIRRLQT